VHGIGVRGIYVETGHTIVEKFKRRAFTYGGISMREFTEFKHFLLTACFFLNECDSLRLGLDSCHPGYFVQGTKSYDLASADIPFSLSGI
jgi:hypothetical protein